MGLTISYGLKSTTKSADKARQLVERMRQLAMDLPFEKVTEIVDLAGDECDYHKNTDQDLRWLLIQSRGSVKCPWNKRVSMEVHPTRVIAFTVLVGPGCEPVNIGLVQFPSEIEWGYKPEDDQRFCRKDKEGWSNFSYMKFRDWADKKFPGKFISENHLTETRKVKTRLGKAWTWSSFCKTQYASDPECGGLPNFLRCHIAVVTFLEKVAELPTVKLDLDDEGHYGPAVYSDDWREASKEGRKPTYVWHEGTYNVATLVAEVGESNERIAALVGALNDATGDKMVAPITSYANFEQLEFKGNQREYVREFLEKMAGLAKNKS